MCHIQLLAKITKKMFTVLFIYSLSALLLFFLSRLTIKWYFLSKQGRYSIKSNYLSKIAILAASGAFFVITPSLVPSLIHWFIDLLNTKTSWELPNINTTTSIEQLIGYGLFCTFLLLVLYLSYQQRIQEGRKEYILRKNEDEDKLSDIQIPEIEEQYLESPFFHERLKKYFELKHKKKGLKLKISTKDKLIYGEYLEGFRKYFIVISYLENEINHDITTDKQTEEFLRMKGILKNSILNDSFDDYLIDFYFISLHGVFETNKSFENYYCLNEDDVLNQLIDFKIYLKRVIQKFRHDKIFSAIAKESEKKSLEETFIMPDFSADDNTLNYDLYDYVSNWVVGSSDYKHLALLGDYGMGKTSFLNYVTYKVALDILEERELNRFPIFISLTNVSPRHGGIKKTLSSFVAENLGVEYELFEILIHKGKLLFLLDAFDEMGFVGTHEDRFKQISEIWKLATRKNKIMFAGRPSYFQSEAELNLILNISSEENEIIQTKPYCSSIRLEELNDDKIKNYLSKYYTASTSKYFHWIESSPSILDLCRRPSLMHIIREMMPKLYKNDSNEINSPGTAFDKYIDYWINRQESKEIQSALIDSLKKRRFVKSFFRHIAVDLFYNGQSKLGVKYLKENLNLFIKNSDIKISKEKYHKEGFENEMLAGYFLEIENDNFKFVHKSFFDYFIASEIIEIIKNKNFKDKLLYENWSNQIVNFVYDSIPTELKTNKSYPALMLLAKNGFFGKLKYRFVRFCIKHNKNIAAFSLLFYFVSGLIGYFHYFALPWYLTAIFLIPLIVILLVSFVWFAVTISNWFVRFKWIKFMVKTLKIAFIKNQFNIKENLDIVLPLLEINSEPYLPFEGINFTDQKFKSCGFYKLKDVVFKNCEFSFPVLKNCHLVNVGFNNLKSNDLIFDKCRFNNVSFDDLSILEDKIKITQIKTRKTPQLYFKKCHLDSITKSNLAQYIKKNNLNVGSDINGTNEFLEQINNFR